MEPSASISWLGTSRRALGSAGEMLAPTGAALRQQRCLEVPELVYIGAFA